MAALSGRVLQVLVGRAGPLGQLGVHSAIGKQAAGRPLQLTPLGFIGDEQADRNLHGGPDKAVHLYAWKHYASWRQELSDSHVLQEAGAFGENLCVEGLDESSVCIADQWRIGSAVLEVSQGRQPCWKLNSRFGVPDMAARVQDSLRAGWYCRVVEPGVVADGDTMELVGRPHPEWSVHRMLALIRDRECGESQMHEVLKLPLTPSWRKLFARRLGSGESESWLSRMLR